jgi:hypothetical protein
MRVNRRGKLEPWHGGEQGVLEFRKANQKGAAGEWKRAMLVKYINSNSNLDMKHDKEPFWCRK